jgi:amino acid adenylation domain-containing protein
MTTADAATLTGVFARSVAQFHDRPAVSDDERALTYRELDERSTAVAGRLAAIGVGYEDRVGVYMDRRVDVVVAILGILKAGAAYVAVDPRYPDSRRDYMLRASDAKVVVAQHDWVDRLSHVDRQVVAFDAPAGSPPRPLVVGPRQAASILFTSGSTGEAKGIVLEHGNIVSFASNPSLPPLRPDDRVGQISSLSFDAFHYELWAPLVAGAEVVILPSVVRLLAVDFRRELWRRRISAMLVPTMVFNHLVREDRDAFSALRLLLVGGDVLLPQAAAALLSGAFRGELYNLYGPAEATTACTAHKITLADAEGGSVPIGRPLDGVTVQMRGSDGEPLDDDGIVGEMYVGGPGVARGYLNRPDLTQERFVINSDPAGPPRLYRTGDLARRRAEGVLEFLGRADDQAKIQGFRVEPAEVERTLRQCVEVRDAVVLMDDMGAERRLVAFVELAGDTPLTAVRRYAEAELPHFMMPHAFVVVDEVPATEHGKRDTEVLRGMLERDSDRRSDLQSPASETERWLAEVWEDLLSVERVGRDDDFFDLGGHSVLAFRMRRRISQRYGVDLDFVVVLGQTALRDLAAAIDDAVVANGA